MRVLLVGPRFHGYSESMAVALRALGNVVTVHAYDEATSTADALRNKIAHDVPGGRGLSLQQRWFDTRAITALDNCRPDVLLVVKGDVFSSRWWDAVDRWGGPTVVWFYDELDRMAYDEASLHRLPVIATYSPSDAVALRHRGIEAHHLPLGFDSLMPWTRRPTGAVTFIGARYPQRESMLRRLHGAGVPVRAYGRDWSRHPSDLVRSRHWKSPGVPAGRNLTRGEAYGVMAGSEATLNIHGRQDGFTMRTFEACGVGALQLVDRSDVDLHFAPDEEVLVFTDDDELCAIAERVVADPVWARGVAAAGQQRALDQHTLVHRMKKLQEWWA